MDLIAVILGLILIIILVIINVILLKLKELIDYIDSKEK